MKRCIIFVSILIVMLIGTGCGGDKKDTKNAKNTPSAIANGSVQITYAPRPTLVRDRPTPPGEPTTFEAPFSAGEFVRESMTGNPTLASAGGIEAIYTSNSKAVRLNAYYFGSSDEAIENARLALESAAVAQVITPPDYNSKQMVLGMAQDSKGGYLAVWTHDRWLFLARTTSDLNTLKAFLDVFPY
jgi:hypothetical protein